MPFAYKNTTKKDDLPLSSPKYKFVLTLWNIDVFEGGVGSRADFLANASLGFKNEGVLVMVVNHTKESAMHAVSQGDLPDMISYGVGVDFVAKYAKSLPKIVFSGGEYDGKTYAYPWCVGSYFLICKNQDNQLIDRLIVSQNTYNMPFGAIYCDEVQANKIEYKAPLDAYVEYLSADTSDVLLGTQRDVKRLEQRGETFYAQPLTKFCDLIQYVSVLTQDRQRYEECVKFLEYLISKKVQEQLHKIGMSSAFYQVENGEVLSRVDFSKVEYTVSPFTSADVIQKINLSFTKKITNNSLLDFKNVLKRL